MNRRVDPFVARVEAAKPDRLWVEAKHGIQSGLARLGYQLSRVDADSIRYLLPSHDRTTPLPRGAVDRLRTDHPRLQELQAAYGALDHPAASPTVWSESFLRRNLSLNWF